MNLLIGALHADDLIRILIFALIFLIPVIGKILTSMRAPQRPVGPQRAPQPPQVQPKVQVQPPKSVKEEIDEFLRRAAQKRQATTVMSAERMAAPAARLAKEEQPVKAEVARPRPVGGEVAEHVKKYLDERQFDQRAEKLGTDVAAADKKIEEHLKDVFGHGISKLAAQRGETAAAPTPAPTGFFQDEVPALSTAGVGVASLLGNIDTLRQAIVLNEILQRPIDRWE
jgi:hypothetical protein